MKEALKCMNNGVKNVQEELIEVNLDNGEEDEKMVKISKNISENEKGRLVALLKEYRDVFAWSYQEMPSLSLNLVVHKLKVDPNFKPMDPNVVANGFAPKILLAHNAKRCSRFCKEVSGMPKVGR